MRRKKNKLGSILFMLSLIGGIALAVFVSFSPMFERQAPQISIVENGYWNLKTPLHVEMEDASGIRSYHVNLIYNNERVLLSNQKFDQAQPKVSIDIDAPKNVAAFNPESVQVEIIANDASHWNLLAGNEAVQSVNLKVDTKMPQVNVIANSMYLYKGGSGIVVFQGNDENLEELYIETNFGKRFKPQPFYKEGFYISLVAWKVTEPSFSAKIVVKDHAGNIRNTAVPFRLRDRKYQISKIKLNDTFLEGKIAELAETFEIAKQTTDRMEQFKLINEEIRAKNEKLIHDITAPVGKEMLQSVSFKPFYPLKNGKKVASFGDHRLYYRNGIKVSESYHLGLDLASVKMGDIHTQNSGEVVYADFNGLYGNMPAIHHGLGLYTIYGHCSNIAVSTGYSVKPGDLIANTGMSGYAMGDHLHFGVLVQGVEVRPEEWMDSKWLQVNIYDTIRDAKKIIDRQ